MTIKAVIAILLIATPALAEKTKPLTGPGSEGIHQPREGKLKDTVFTARPMIEITSCLTDYWSRFGRTKIIDRAGGSKTFELYVEAPSLARATDPTLTIEITEREQRRVDLYTTWIMPRPGRLWDETKAKCL